MNKRAFTLIELLAVIVILAIILVIAVPKIFDIINATNIQAYISNNKMMIKATETYMTTNVDKFPVNIGDTYEVKLSDLQDNKLIKEIKSPENRNSICNGYILVTKTDNDVYDYAPFLNCVDGFTANSYLSDGLVAYFKFDNNAYDYTPNNNHGVIYGAIPTTDRFGNNNKALSFGANADTKVSVNGPLTGIYSLQKYSWGSWIKISSSFLSAGRILMSQTNVLELNISASRKLSACTRDAIGFKTISSTDSLVLNKWHHLFATFDGTTTKIFIDGNMKGTVSSVGLIDPSNNIYIGNWVTGQQFLGDIDDVMIYNRGLSAEEVKHIYEISKKDN